MTRPLRIVHNRPGLAAIAYRIGTHARFKHDLLARLTAEPALRGLTTRSDDDFSIALLDAWSCAADVITFYQERLANESWLRTASERRSLGYLARLLGAELGPGVAAGVPVVFTVDAIATKNLPVPLAPGLKLQSIPAPGEQPQTFELDAPAAVRAAHNELRATQTEPAPQPTYSLRLAATVEDLTGPGRRPLPLLVSELRTENPQQTIEGPLAPPRVLLLRDHTVLPEADGVVVTWRGADHEPAPSSLVAVLRDRRDILELGEFDDADTLRVLLEPGPVSQLEGLVPILLATPDGTETPSIATVVEDTAEALVLALPPPQPADLETADATLPSLVQLQVGQVETRLRLAGKLVPGDVLLARRTDSPSVWRIAPVSAARSDRVATDLVVTQWFSSHPLPPQGAEDLFLLRGRAAVYGHNAPDARLLKDTAADLLDNVPPKAPPNGPPPPPLPPIEWTNFALPDDAALDLDAVYPDLQVGDPLIVRDGDLTRFATIVRVATVTRADFSLGARVSRVTLTGGQGPPLSRLNRRTAEVYFHPEPLVALGGPRVDPVEGLTIDLQGALQGLAPDNTLLFTGPHADTGLPVQELAVIAATTPSASQTTVTLDAPLRHRYRRDALIVRANLAFASHGESVQETLGSGDATVPLQRFALKQGPLTFVSAANARGRVNTLRITVDGDLWREVDTFEGAGPRDRIYTVALTEGGGAVVQFGDGVRGARLPSGTANVRAAYRRGIGLVGMIGRDQLAILATPTLGVTIVTNPLPASGAAPPDDLADIRRNAPLPVRTLGRVVSLPDYADFARAFAGVAKAHAVAFRDRGNPGVLVTVAGVDGASIPTGSTAADRLLAALRAAGDPFVTVRLRSHDPSADPRPVFTFAGTVLAAPDRDPDRLRADLDAALVARFGFAASEFARPVFRSAVIAAIQAVPGVVAVDLTDFARLGAIAKPPRPGGKPDPESIRLLAHVAASPDDPRPTEILTLDPGAPARLKVTR